MLPAELQVHSWGTPWAQGWFAGPQLWSSISGFLLAPLHPQTSRCCLPPPHGARPVIGTVYIFKNRQRPGPSSSSHAPGLWSDVGVLGPESW